MLDVSRYPSFPVLPLRDIVVFPHMIVPLFVGRAKSVKALEAVPELNAISVPVHEAAAVTFAGTEAGKAEAPELPASARTALSMGRYVQDPLAEIVHYDPTRLALGQAQRDVDQGALRRLLDDTLEDCVAWVGVDLNVQGTTLAPGLDLAGSNRFVVTYDLDGTQESNQVLQASAQAASSSAYASNACSPRSATTLSSSSVFSGKRSSRRGCATPTSSV